MRSGNRAGLILWGLLLLTLFACSAPQTRLALQRADHLPAQATVKNVPFYPQKEYYCGPAALAMMLTWAGIAATQDEIATQVYTPGRQGTLPVDLLAGARRNGVLAVEVVSLQDVLGEIAAGNPVLVFQNLGMKFMPRWHFAVAIGYDLTSESLILHSGIDPQRNLNLHTFEQTWQRADYWAITVTPADRLPTRANETAVLKAAAGLERAEQYIAAITAYKAIAERWPGSIIARMGLGNTEAKRGNHIEAARAFLDAIEIDDNYAAAWHNLANSLAAQQLYDEAVKAADKAVSLEGDNELYRNTLTELIKRQRSPDYKALSF